MKKSVKIGIIIAVVLAVIIGVFVIVISALNKERTPITAETFKTTMEAKGYLITDATNQFAQYGYIETAYLAQKDGYQIEFYVLSDAEYAESFYNVNKSEFANFEATASATATITMKNYAQYSLTAVGKYKYVSRIDNTVIYLDVDTTYKDSAKAIIDEIGY